MDIKIIVALIGIVGVLTSALVQYYLGRQSEARKKNIEIRMQAYLDLLNAVSVLAGSAKHNDNRKLEQLQNLIQAKTRSVLVGSEEVVKAINCFWLNHGSLDTEEACSSYVSIVAAMRKDLSVENVVTEKLLFGALFGKV